MDEDMCVRGTIHRKQPRREKARKGKVDAMRGQRKNSWKWAGSQRGDNALMSNSDTHGRGGGDTSIFEPVFACDPQIARSS